MNPDARARDSRGMPWRLLCSGASARLGHRPLGLALGRPGGLPGRRGGREAGLAAAAQGGRRSRGTRSDPYEAGVRLLAGQRRGSRLGTPGVTAGRPAPPTPVRPASVHSLCKGSGRQSGNRRPSSSSAASGSAAVAASQNRRRKAHAVAVVPHVRRDEANSRTSTAGSGRKFSVSPLTATSNTASRAGTRRRRFGSIGSCTARRRPPSSTHRIVAQSISAPVYVFTVHGVIFGVRRNRLLMRERR